LGQLRPRLGYLPGVIRYLGRAPVMEEVDWPKMVGYILNPWAN